MERIENNNNNNDLEKESINNNLASKVYKEWDT